MACLGEEEDAGFYTLRRTVAPDPQGAACPVGDQVITVFNCHLKSKLGEFIKPQGAPFAARDRADGL